VEWTSSYYVTIPNRILIKHDLIDDNIIKKHEYNSPPTICVVLSIEYAKCSILSVFPMCQPNTFSVADRDYKNEIGTVFTTTNLFLRKQN
jgi:hypothetical protein